MRVVFQPGFDFIGFRKVNRPQLGGELRQKLFGLFGPADPALPRRRKD